VRDRDNLRGSELTFSNHTWSGGVTVAAKNARTPPLKGRGGGGAETPPHPHPTPTKSVCGGGGGGGNPGYLLVVVLNQPLFQTLLGSHKQYERPASEILKC
jgi:hypothetical protein